MAFSSDEVNYLIYRYLKESGFQHSAFTFGHESNIVHIDVNPSDVQVGSLINIIQKGMLYEELEAVISKESESEPTGLAKTINKSLRQSGKKKAEKEAIGSSGTFPLTSSTASVGASSGNLGSSSSAISATSTPGNVIDERTVEVRKENVLVLEGHSSEVFMCQWNPKQPLLASGSADSTVRIWKLPSGPISSRAVTEQAKQPLILKHVAAKEGKSEKSKDVTSLDWNPAGTLLATGSFDGVARVWDTKGALKMKLQRHTLPVFSLKWSKNGDYLLSGSADKMAIVWDAANGSVKQVFDFHTQACLDVDWRNNTSFATCSSDMRIHVNELGKNKPVMTFEGHTHEVNAIKWDPQGQLLASCSDDKTAKIWKLDSQKPVWDFADHDLEIYTIRWSPTGAGSKNPSKSLLLATASFDKTVKLWDATVGKCVSTLSKHDEAVYSVAFSPDGDYLASGSFDKCVHIWSVKDGSLVKTYKGSGGIFDVSWSSGGERVAACFSDNTVSVIDFRM